ncbi:GGDEF domain-containing protein [Qipengyuania sp. XHP0207]|uniref:GGDEF domain-containing protein n=1 Tax=Qipengyuania sp. XHP0207 TaxID=3038078 RepID=UPI00241EE1D7|nr:GGDEF domain-containing protein [Qipengyuania sp. XHP0207]MDG5748714.1 GGDEF domain-containing protein [Qipengyuania sp. XHP0207]
MTEKILAMANPLLCTVFALSFIALWRRDTSTSWPVMIAFAYAAQAVGFFIFHFTGNPNGVVAITAMHLFYSAGASAMMWGICARNGQRAPLALFATIAVISLALMVAATIGANYNARLYAANAAYGLILALGCQVAASKTEKEFLDKVILWLIAIGAFQFFVRPITAIMVEGAMTAEEYRATPFYAVMVVWLAVSSLLIALSLMIAALTDQMRSVREASKLDSLTRLRTRRAFESDVMEAFEKAKADHVPLSLVVADIDHFKGVNDVYGHQVGDRAIAEFGNVLSGMIRHADVAGRIGGEEFCILAWNCDEEKAHAMAERIRRRFAETAIPGMPAGNRLTASFGVAGRRSGEGYGKLFARADAELYRAKHGGRNRVCHEEMPGVVVAEFKPKGVRKGAAA